MEEEMALVCIDKVESVPQNPQHIQYIGSQVSGTFYTLNHLWSTTAKKLSVKLDKPGCGLTLYASNDYSGNFIGASRRRNSDGMFVVIPILQDGYITIVSNNSTSASMGGTHAHGGWRRRTDFPTATTQRAMETWEIHNFWDEVLKISYWG